MREFREVGYGGGCTVLPYGPTEFIERTKSGEEPVLRDVAEDWIVLWDSLPASPDLGCAPHRMVAVAEYPQLQMISWQLHSGAELTEKRH